MDKAAKVIAGLFAAMIGLCVVLMVILPDSEPITRTPTRRSPRPRVQPETESTPPPRAPAADEPKPTRAKSLKAVAESPIYRVGDRVKIVRDGECWGVDVLLSRRATEAEMIHIGNDLLNNELARTGPIQGMVFLFHYPVAGGRSRFPDVVIWAPGGDWSRRGDVQPGHYDSFEFKVVLEDKRFGR